MSPSHVCKLTLCSVFALLLLPTLLQVHATESEPTDPPSVDEYRDEFAARNLSPSLHHQLLDEEIETDVLSQAGTSLGPCRGDFITIPVFTEAHFQLRSSIPATVPVLLVLQRNITLSRGLVFDDSFACTRVIAPSPVASLIEYPYGNMPAVTVVNSSNVWLHGVSIRHGANNQSGACASPLFVIGQLSPTQTCPGVYIVSSFGVQITQSSIVGRVDIFRSMRVLLDHVSATINPGTYDSGHPYRDYRTHGVINIGQVRASIGVNGSDATVRISNCEIYGAWELITLFQGASGVRIFNNFLHDFTFAAVRCGLGPRYVMDCHDNLISKNFILNQPEDVNTTDRFNAGIYLHTKWFNPGNVLSCNMIHNQRYCYRLAGQSSGVTVEGGTCLNTNSAVRIDTGKFNTVEGLLVRGATTSPSTITCWGLYTVNCFRGLGNNWEALRRAYYQTEALNETYPFMQKICDPVRSSVSNVQCNPPSQVNATVAQTGYCSSLPWGNSVEVFLAGGPNPPSQFQEKYTQCDNLTVNLALLNTQSWLNWTEGFPNATSLLTSETLNATGGGTSVQGESEDGAGASDARPKPIKCPWSQVGPQVVDEKLHIRFFNISEPALFRQAFNLSELLDPTLVVPVKEIEVVP